MLGNFPDPYPDELLYSVCARYKKRLMYSKDLNVFRDLFGVTYKVFDINQPTGLQYILQELSPGHCYSIEQLIQENTLVPFYQAFCKKGYFQTCKKQMSESSYLKGGWVSEDIQTPKSLRFCPICVEDEKKYFGEPYWHRLHQIAGVEVCPVHQVFLQFSNVPLNPNYRISNFRTAAETTVAGDVEPLIPSDSTHAIFLKIAEDVAWLLDQKKMELEADCLRNFYVTLFAQNGYIENQRLEKRNICADFLQRYSNIEVLNQLQFSRFGYTSFDYTEMEKEVMRARYSYDLLDRLILTPFKNHPLRHLLMIQFLGYSLKDFFQRISKFRESYKQEYSFSKELECFGCREPWVHDETDINRLQFNNKDSYYEGRLPCKRCNTQRYVKLSPVCVDAELTVLRFSAESLDEILNLFRTDEMQKITDI
jgi:hypothetical protein